VIHSEADVKLVLSNQQLTYELDSGLVRDLSAVPPGRSDLARWQILMRPRWVMPISL